MSRGSKQRRPRLLAATRMAALRNGLPTEHPLFEKLIMGEELTLAVLYALAEKHAL